MSHSPKSNELGIGDTFKIGKDTYKVTSFLPGRGPGKGLGFFATKDDGKTEVIVKEDKLSILVAEGLTTTSDIPDASKSAIQANLGILKKDVSSPPTLVTIQPKFQAKEGEKVDGFDVFILGRKREPKTIWSEESTNREIIKMCINKMNEPVKKQLAKAIFLSQLNGDESLHIGQFMVSVKESKITGIVKVDFGALGRWAGERANKEDFDILKTSKAYRNTFSQAGNDYVSFLLQNNTVRQELFELWATLDRKEFIQSVEKKFNELCGVLGEAGQQIRDKTLRDFYNDVLFKGCSQPSLEQMEGDDLINFVRTAFLETTKKRFDYMSEQAQIEKMTIYLKTHILNLPEYASFASDIDKISNLKDLIKYLGDNIKLTQHPDDKVRESLGYLSALKDQLEQSREQSREQSTTMRFKQILSKQRDGKLVEMKELTPSQRTRGGGP